MFRRLRRCKDLEGSSGFENFGRLSRFEKVSKCRVRDFGRG